MIIPKPAHFVRHAHTWLGIGLLWCVSRLPWGVQRFLADAFGAFCFHVIPVRRHVVMVNLRTCFPAWTEAERRRVARRHYQSLALGILEVARCWWRPTDMLPPCRLEGLEHLVQAREAGRPVLLVSGHFTTLEIAGRMLSLRTPLCCLYRDPNNPVLAGLFRKHRSVWAPRAIEMDDLAGLLRTLRRGEAVWYAPDQGKRTASSMLLPFFGEPAITNTATSKLAQLSNALVIPFLPRREEDGSYTLTVLPPLTDFPSRDAAADTQRFTTLLEDAIRRAPEQYLWVHRRFKSRDGLPDIYAKDSSSARR